MPAEKDPFDAMWQVGTLPDVRPFQLERRADLVAGALRRIGNNKWVIFEEKTPLNQVRIVKNIAPFAQRRININTPQETLQAITPAEGDGWFAFDPQVAGRSVETMNIDFNAPNTAGGTLNNDDRAQAAGTSFLSRDPKVDAQRWNPLYNFVVQSQTTLAVNFSLLPLATATPLPNTPQVGDAAGLVLNRIDFAGVVVFGVQMAVATYQTILEQGRIK